MLKFLIKMTEKGSKENIVLSNKFGNCSSYVSMVIAFKLE